MLRALMDKVDSMQKQMDSVSREIKIQRYNFKKRIEIKNTVTELKNAFDGLIKRQDMTEERISLLENIFIESSKLESKENKD